MGQWTGWSLFGRGTRRYTSTTKQLDVLFFGTDSFSLPCLKALHQSQIVNRLEVVTPPDAKSGRGYKTLKPTLVKMFCEQNSILTYQPNLKQIAEFNLQTTYDLAIVVSYGAFLPKSLLEKFPKGGLNVHPSLLPKYRGPAPLLNTLWNQDKQCGITVQQLSTQAFDAGAILAQRSWPVEHTSYLPFLERMAELGAQLLLDTLENLDTRLANRWEQDPTQVTKANKLNKSLATIHFPTDPHHLILKKVQVLSWKFPILTHFQTIPVHLDQLELKNVLGFHHLELGTPIWYHNQLLIKVQGDLGTEFLKVGSLKLKDRNRLDAKQFYLTYIKNHPQLELELLSWENLGLVGNFLPLNNT